jgi:hypothetical protein
MLHSMWASLSGLRLTFPFIQQLETSNDRQNW